MRPLHPVDLDLAARALRAVPIADRRLAALWIVRAARLADLFRKRLGRRHPVCGDGTVGAAAMALSKGTATMIWYDRDYRVSLCYLLSALDDLEAFDLGQVNLYGWVSPQSEEQRHGRHKNQSAQP